MNAREKVGRGVVVGSWWDALDGGVVRCELCPRRCELREGQRGFCYVRENRGGRMVLTAYGRAIGMHVDPIEKKPLNHFMPGTGVLSFGTAGCNLGCSFCQNWEMSRARDIERAQQDATPDKVVQMAQRAGCRSVAFTYNEPTIFAEYAIDAARACHEAGVKTVVVTDGYIACGARGEFYEHMDGANVDLKAFTEDFYAKMCAGALAPVLETLQWLRDSTDVWVEVTTLLVPTKNDDEGQLRAMCDWLVEHMGPDTPLHFTAFHPSFKVRDLPRTPPSTLTRAQGIAKSAGLRYVYTGNVFDPRGQSTFCPSCGELLVERDGYRIGTDVLSGKGSCSRCGTEIAGRW